MQGPVRRKLKLWYF
ncbi:uncharacterized protein FRV6_16957 [Fusarium oxysporum]|uniref:Uncharacterized protein n=1 Tax=Fusarium oxysporum TaxID=5507 RepID=A0A2H3UGA5_FUSOX|nr:uncharacterized protein FRV6_16957 [Fusarium oxysporum]